MFNPASGSTSPTKTTMSGFETNMTSYPDDETMSVGSSVQQQLVAPPPTGPNTVVGEKLPTAQDIGDRLLYGSAIRIARSTPATSVIAPQDVPELTITEPKEKERERIGEHGIWLEVAEEKLIEGLKRLMQYAKDMHALNASKTVEEYYGEALAKLVKEGEVQFDVNYLK